MENKLEERKITRTDINKIVYDRIGPPEDRKRRTMIGYMGKYFREYEEVALSFMNDKKKLNTVDVFFGRLKPILVPKRYMKTGFYEGLSKGIKFKFERYKIRFQDKIKHR